MSNAVTSAGAVRERFRRPTADVVEGESNVSIEPIDPVGLGDDLTRPVERSRTITLRVSSDEYDAMAGAAADQGLSLSAWVRRVCAAEAGRPSVWTREERNYLERVQESYRRVGINLNQVARAVNGGRISHARQLQTTLRDLSRLTERMTVTCAYLAKGMARKGGGRARGGTAADLGSKGAVARAHAVEVASADTATSKPPARTDARGAQTPTSARPTPPKPTSAAGRSRNGRSTMVQS